MSLEGAQLFGVAVDESQLRDIATFLDAESVVLNFTKRPTGVILEVA